MNLLGVKQYLATAYHPESQGDSVLLLLPTYKTSLQAKFEGPYEVVDKCGSDRYVIITPGRRKAARKVHANNMKLFPHRQTVMTVRGEVNSAQEEDNFIPTVPRINNSSIIHNLDPVLQHLCSKEREDVKTLLVRFPEILQDVPQQCVVASHNVVLVDGVSPIKQAPYRMSPCKREILRKEVQFLIDNGLAEHSSSEWASPCLLVPKPDGSSRLCTDYRRVNEVTRTDSYPLSRIDDILDSIGNSRFLTKLDLLKGYYQAVIEKEGG
ncbi:hypothetical protein Pmani_004795 [Petrolisthes manimaculis]|uniref:Polyprotein n=1 Tax=Petrolisthes manimaculis TaxID=1843537 RepID=A0AAE1QDK0_9EUCA|nr:hypothetical protein Pmani_004795 [Petrolisthes manimaculis]